ncbi:transposase [Alistipes sp.]|uniref:transposase n=1 Tax=Alistipes sp. TaxID=1872444 RepID=UPI003AF1BAF4
MPKGRNKQLIANRNEALCRRWYYWTEMERLRFDDALKILSEREFFISEQRVLAIIREYSRMNPDSDIKPKPKVKVPRLTSAQLRLFAGE